MCVCMCARKRGVKKQEEGEDMKEPGKKEREKGREVDEGYVG